MGSGIDDWPPRFVAPSSDQKGYQETSRGAFKGGGGRYVGFRDSGLGFGGSQKDRNQDALLGRISLLLLLVS